MKNKEKESKMLILEDSDGVETPFEVVSETEYDGRIYVVLLPANEFAEEYLILQKKGSGEFCGIADENELNSVYKRFLEENSGK